MNLTEDLMKSYLRTAYNAASHSPDQSTQVGGAAYTLFDSELRLVATGFNNVSSGMRPDGENIIAPRKYQVILHAEQQTCVKCLVAGFTPDLLVSNYAACADCAKIMVAAGVKTLLRHKTCMVRTPERWKESIEVADQICSAGGIEIIEFEGFIGACPIRLNGELLNA